MAARDVATLGGLVLQIAAKIQQVGDDWYRASADWEDFPRKVDLLRQKYYIWQAEFSKFGISDANLRTTLEKARSLLAEAEDKLTKRQAKGGAGCCSKLSMVAFPAQIGLSIERVNDAFDAVSDILKYEEDAHEAVQKKLLRDPSPLDCREDAYHRYVHLEALESKVYSSLEDPAGPTVCLLHGGAGRGKSTLARHIALHYDKSCHFDRVVGLLLCGSKVKALHIQLDLLRRLGVDTTALSDEGQPNSNFSISKLLEGVLKDQKILIILDDLWEGDFLQAMVNLCGNGVKFLVTSQDENLCHGFNFIFSPIKIHVDKEHGRKMLASHVGFSSQLIPEKIMGLADRFVRETDGNPLALALIATGIDHKRLDELESWEAASSNFFQLLASECTTYDVLGDRYPKSFIAAMKLSMQALSNNAKTLLILTYLCEGPSVPEEVVSVLYKYLEGPTMFYIVRRELESREWLKIATDDLSETQQPQRSWSIHSLQHLFIDYEMKDHIESILMRLVALMELKIMGKTPPDEDTMVQVGLCALYLDSRFAERVASKICITMERFAKFRRDAIEPVTRLLGQPISDRWTAAALSSTRQVFLAYIYDGKLHSEGISHLLASPVSALPTLIASRSIALLEKRVLHEIINSPGILQLVKSLSEDANPRLQQNAGLALFYLATTEETRLKIINFPSALEAFSLFLSKDNHPALQACAARVFFRMAETNVGEIKLEMINSPGLLQQLVRSLFKYANPCLQQNAILAFGNLAATEEIRLQIASFPSALEELTLLSSKGDYPVLQKMYSHAECQCSKESKIGIQGCAAAALTRIHPTRGNEVKLYSGPAYLGRGIANLWWGQDEQALTNLHKANELESGNATNLWALFLAKARLKDFQGALADANSLIEVELESDWLQERGVLKRMMGDLPGAGEDLDLAIALDLSLGLADDYERTKNREHVAFLMDNEDEARAYAE